MHSASFGKKEKRPHPEKTFLFNDLVYLQPKELLMTNKWNDLQVQISLYPDYFCIETAFV